MPSKAAAIENGDSVMQLERVKGSVRCCEPKCSRQGRYRMKILSTYIETDSLILSNRYVLFCTPCATEIRRSWNELAGIVDEAPVLEVAV